ncbi:MAG: hypothetical protein QOF68_1921 [Gaiellales bacterium]|jgi:uncharacterized RDD family membrane protein YckC|nr:hypothetical protein [Gaiellales bacterium]
MYCRNCGAQIPEGAQFCPSCGVAAVDSPDERGFAGATDWSAGPPTSYAGFWKRAAAFLIDAIILAVPNAIILAALGRSSGDLVVLVLDWLYFAYQESSEAQATLGKRALGIKVTDVEGNRITFARATGRYFAKILSALTLLIGYIMAAFTARKQALHDLIAGTLVVNR